MHMPSTANSAPNAQWRTPLSAFITHLLVIGSDGGYRARDPFPARPRRTRALMAKPPPRKTTRAAGLERLSARFNTPKRASATVLALNPAPHGRLHSAFTAK